MREILKNLSEKKYKITIVNGSTNEKMKLEGTKPRGRIAKLITEHVGVSPNKVKKLVLRVIMISNY